MVLAIVNRRKKFDEFLIEHPIHLKDKTIKFTCPCCGYPTLAERDRFDICRICHWEDDNQDDKDADKVKGGPNGDLSLTQARYNFDKYFSIEGKITPHDEPFLEIKNKLIRLYEKLLTATPSELDQLSKEINDRLIEEANIFSREIKKWEENLKKSPKSL